MFSTNMPDEAKEDDTRAYEWNEGYDEPAHLSRSSEDYEEAEWRDDLERVDTTDENAGDAAIFDKTQGEPGEAYIRFEEDEDEVELEDWE